MDKKEELKGVMSETLENAENKEQNKIEVDDLEMIVTGSSEEGELEEK